MSRLLSRVSSLRVAAAIAGLVLSLGLVVRLSVALSPLSPETRSEDAASRAIVLRDDADGRALFDDVDLAPGEQARRCVQLFSDGTRRPSEVVLDVTSRIDPGVTDDLTAVVERGDGDCADLGRTVLVARGPAADVLAGLDEMPAAWVPLDEEAGPNGWSTTYRFTIALDGAAADEVQGAGIAFGLQWSTAFRAAGDGPVDTALALLVRTTEDTVIPILLILSLAVLFLGLQERLDRNASKLAHADTVDQLVPFRRRGET